MVHRIPPFMISPESIYAILVSRSHPHSGNIMSGACQQALESCGAKSEDIYIIDCPSDTLLPGLCREAAKTGLFSAVIGLAALPDCRSTAAALTAAMASTDFEVPVIPALVSSTAGDAEIARAAEYAGRSAVELANLALLFEEFTIASSVDIIDQLGDEVEAASVRDLSDGETGNGADYGRRRGRPPAHVEAEPAGKKPAKSTKPAAQATRRRGRPPKSASAGDVAKQPAKQTGKKRGRPKKNA